MKKSKIIFLLILLSVFAFLLFFTDFKDYLRPARLKQLIDDLGFWGPLVFMLISYLATLSFVSTIFLTTLAGTLFGFLSGSFYVVIAATLAGQTAFLISRFLGEGVLEKIPNQKIKEMIKKLEGKVRDNSFRVFFISRCLFLPYAPFSYAAGLIKNASGWAFFWATLITNAIFTQAFVYFGDALTRGYSALFLPAGLIVLVLLVPRVVRRFRSGG